MDVVHNRKEIVNGLRNSTKFFTFYRKDEEQEKALKKNISPRKYIKISTQKSEMKYASPLNRTERREKWNRK